MLGRYADQFFAKQASERVLAGQPNGDARSMNWPDREAAGTGKIAMVKGNYEMPGPQRSVNANTMLPSMGAVEESAAVVPGPSPIPSNRSNMLPSMGAWGASNMLPSMGSAEMLPNMGALDMGKLTPWLIGGGLTVAALIFLRRRKRAS